MVQAPMISVPLKATNEIDWIVPLKNYIRDTYGDDPERYAEECATLNRLRQDMRGAGKDSSSGRDLLYRYYGQLELLDLRFPVDEQHIRISFTWFDAFTHKATSQFSLAFEKASIIFNISAVLSCNAALQNRSDESGLKTAYHSFQASAGMFTYINENFLHAPSADLSRETVKTLISITLAQAQEVFLEKQIADQKKVGLLAKLASHASSLYAQAAEGVQANVDRAIFEKVWLYFVQIKASLMGSMAQYFQGLADDDANNHGLAVSRLQVAETLGKEAAKLATSFPSSLPSSANLGADTSTLLVDITKRHLSTVQEKLRGFNKDNDFIYHDSVPDAASLPPVSKLPACKPIPVSELYAGQDIQRITGPDLFAKIIPLSVTESASLYDEEKAKILRAETERVDTANSEMAASLDYLRLPGALQVLKGGFDQEVLPDEDFRTWCVDVADHESPEAIFEPLRHQREAIIATLDKNAKQLDMEESVCEKMRSKYESEWTQQPSSRLTTTLRGDIKNYRDALDEAATSDGLLASKLRQNSAEFDEMRTAAQHGEVDALFQRALAKVRGKSGSQTTSPSEGNLLDTDFEDSHPSVPDQINTVDEILSKLNLVKRERNQVLKDLKDKVSPSVSSLNGYVVSICGRALTKQIHDDDISQILILNKKSIANYETQLFKSELEKFRTHQNRLVQANHKQAALMKELTAAFNTLLQDKRVRSEQSKYESVQRQRASVVNKYKRAYQEFLDLEAGLNGAKRWYADMKETVDSLEKNVETFVNNRRSEGAQLLNQIEQDRSANKGQQAELERERLRGLMERMSVDTTPSSQPQPPANGASSTPPLPSSSGGLSGRPTPMPLYLSNNNAPRYPATNFTGQYQVPNSPPPNQTSMPSPYASQFGQQAATYNPSALGRIPGPASPPPTMTSFNMNAMRGPASPPPTQTAFGQPGSHQYSTYGNQQASQPPTTHSSTPSSFVPAGFVPPPPPRAPPPLGPQQTYHVKPTDYYSQQQQQQPPPQQQQYQQSFQQQAPPPQQAPADPWAGLNSWK
ncbi:vacuolar protein-sorting protein BRO1 [Sporothrix schenckii 1099-18]|uniref:BRO domain-containing protein 1 n=1 Tax=Sporothrix schenckii 1099-18 TaxID=1397361 RepID=A0A0F2M6V9_SPOSC|nr:vacuolar protein-sorting protein BRO1 [Sporothrix schenckii 1099-18]KJR84540.1 vacuolar protein-sorting protein BRO1 [Sporothrix schenckii 1099-18]